MKILVPGGGRPYVEGDALDHTQPLVWAVDGVLSPAECAAQIARIDALGPTDAPVTTSSGPVMRPDIRNNRRVVLDDAPLAQLLYDRLGDAIPATLANARKVGANERFRCYRYDPGQRFAPHFDGHYARSDRERSHLTLMIYLNDDFTGGQTMFHHFDTAAQPRTGSALLFQHHLLHEGCLIERGVKYVLRSDVMYAD